jgi:uncharacterized protein (DUF305 family)
MFQKVRVSILAIAFVGVPAIAQSQDAAENAFMDAKMKMHESMPTDYTGDPDVEFVRSMIPHHQGAIDMAQVELKYGKNPQARAFAEKIIEAQKAEIEQLNAWLKQHGH